MEADRLLKVADIIEERPEHFDMEWFYGSAGTWVYSTPVEASELAAWFDLDECGTTACIAGWACYLWPAEVDPTKEIDVNARRILGLPSTSLFYRTDLPTAAKAAAALRDLANEAAS